MDDHPGYVEVVMDQAVAAGTVTLLEGACVCVGSASGDIVPGGSQGMFFLDTRLVSELRVFVNGEAPEPLAVGHDDPFAATFVGRCRPVGGARDSTVVVERRRYIGHGMREDLVIRNLAPEATYCQIELRVDADFAALADVRAGRAHPAGEVRRDVSDGALELSVGKGGRRQGLRLIGHGSARIEPDRILHEAIVPARGEWRTCLEVVPVVDGEEVEPRYRCGEPVERATPAERLERWRRSVPAIETDHVGLATVLMRSAEDLGALRVFDPDVPERAVIAAGAPWSMNLVARDALLTAWMALIVDPDLALGVLETLARFQGRETDPRTEEEPGRIPHLVRFGARTGAGPGQGRLSYGSVDSTPLFVMLLGELRRWGLAPELVDRLLPHADRALAWLLESGDRDGDGYVEYQRATDRGRVHQGWKDTVDAIQWADGRPAQPPIALAEVQGYAYSAYQARGHFAREAGDEVGAERWRSRAEALRAAFNRDFWLEDRGWLAVGLDADNEPIDALASNMGHCLWTGILEPDRAAVVADRLVEPELFSGWGVRTLATSMAGYNPLGYHTGAVWPHDTAICAAGLMRYGFIEHAQRVVMAQLDAALASGGRLPELFAGFDRDDLGMPVAFPGSCSPQAVAAASSLLALRTLLRFEPWIPAGRLWLAPALPPEIGRLRIDNVPLLGGRITIEVDGDAAKVEGLPAEVALLSEPRSPLSGGHPSSGP